MTPERWEKLKHLCPLALERDAKERVSFLRDACSGDAGLLRDAQSIIARATSGGGILAGPISKNSGLETEPGEVVLQEDQPQTESLLVRSTTAATVIGKYHLLQKIGEGGMGEVWLAEQKEPVRRRVALKLVKAGLNTREVVGRFESERQALALMEHPAIARVFDAGSTGNGAPYFAMEYVAGVPITEYCDNHRLPIKERLDLFIQVCEGVRHAHQKAVIHRDLKPSNVLVEELDGRPVPKIIDFDAREHRVCRQFLTQRLGHASRVHLKGLDPDSPLKGRDLLTIVCRFKPQTKLDLEMSTEFNIGQDSFPHDMVSNRTLLPITRSTG